MGEEGGKERSGSLYATKVSQPLYTGIRPVKTVTERRALGNAARGSIINSRLIGFSVLIPGRSLLFPTVVIIAAVIFVCTSWSHYAPPSM